MTDPALHANGNGSGNDQGSAIAVLRNRPFLLLWLSQLATQIGVNMVLYGLTVVVLEATDLSSAVSGLFVERPSSMVWNALSPASGLPRYSNTCAFGGAG